MQRARAMCKSSMPKWLLIGSCSRESFEPPVCTMSSLSWAMPAARQALPLPAQPGARGQFGGAAAVSMMHLSAAEGKCAPGELDHDQDR